MKLLTKPVVILPRIYSMLNHPLLQGWSRYNDAYRAFQVNMITCACLSIISLNLLVGLLDFSVSYEIYGLISFSALTVLLINKKGYYQAARWIFILEVYLLATLLFVTGVLPILAAFLCFLAFAANVILFSREEKMELALSFTIPVLLFAIVQLLDITLLANTNLSELFSHSALIINIGFILLSVVLSILYLFSIYEKSEKDLRTLVVELQAKEQEIMLQNEELLTLNASLTASQEELIKSKIFLNSVIDNLPLSLSVKDARELRYIRVNKASEDLLLYSKSEYLGKNDADLLPMNQAALCKEEDLAVVRTKEAIESERVVTIRNQENKILYTRKLPICDSTGEPMFIISISEDITPRKNAEEVLKKTVKELQTRNHELDNYVYRVSHDLRAPFCSMQGLINLARYENDIESLKHYIDLIEKSVGKSDRFIQSILNHSKVLNAELQTEAIDLQALVQNGFHEVHYIAGADQIKLDIQVRGAGEFYSDEFRANIILHNLIANAAKYTRSDVEDKFIKVDITISPEQAIVTITDNGEGITEQHLPKIFDMFFRGSEQATGSGLGLYIALQAAEALGGSISVKSQSNKGSTFTVILPNNSRK
jgi:PAS domain S-box-containing protein